MTERRESLAQDELKRQEIVPQNRRVSLQLEISERFSLDRDPGNTHHGHDPWPQHYTKKQHHVPRKSRRQSVISQELQAMGCLDWSNQATNTHEPVGAPIRQLSVDRRHSLMPQHQDAMNNERRQSTCPGVKAQLESMQKEEAAATASLEKAEKKKYSLLANSDEKLTEENSPSSHDEETPNVDSRKDSQPSVSAGVDHEEERNDTSATSGSREQPLVSQASERLAQSNKLEDQINLQHLVELMRIFYVS